MRRSLPLLALAPLAGVTDRLITALAVALLGLFVAVACGLLLAPLRLHLASRRAVQVGALILGAALVSFAELGLRATSYALYQALALYLPLLIVPCLAMAWHEPADRWAGLRPGLLFALLAILLGTLREVLGHGTLLAEADWLLGPQAPVWQGPATLAVLTDPAGALILLGLLLAVLRLFNRNDPS